MSHPQTIDLPNALVCANCGSVHLDPMRVDRCQECRETEYLVPRHIPMKPTESQVRTSCALMLLEMAVGMQRLIASSYPRQRAEDAS